VVISIILHINVYIILDVIYFCTCVLYNLFIFVLFLFKFEILFMIFLRLKKFEVTLGENKTCKRIQNFEVKKYIWNISRERIIFDYYLKGIRKTKINSMVFAYIKRYIATKNNKNPFLYSCRLPMKIYKKKAIVNILLSYIFNIYNMHI